MRKERGKIILIRKEHTFLDREENPCKDRKHFCLVFHVIGIDTMRRETIRKFGSIFPVEIGKFIWIDR